MPVTDYFLLWKVTLPSTWISALIGFFFAWLAVRKKFGKLVADSWGDAIFTIIIVWKLSVIVTDFKTVRRAPMAILYFNGGIIGFIGGIAAAALVLFFSRKPMPNLLTQGVFTGIVFAQAGYQVSMAFLNDASLASKAITIIFFALLAILVYRYSAHEELPLSYSIGMFIAAHAFIAAIQPVGFKGIPFLATVIASVLVLIIKNRIEKRTELDGGVV
ncbi:hypothetical protein [Sporosarcina aquimarina]|uniref:Uncharacterized protein n=1 Tax=Sporosarcina aquimarina TaxID=114975 RepID=A0ABU4G3A5_9BACL|nr:hypothetical protein [Sporosarcina aquimarina]MDW0111451.1 hypothetical protein [Sporosarcina aquimarina]